MRSIRWYIAAGIGLLLFILIQVWPSLSEKMKPGEHNALERTEARARALSYAEEKWHILPAAWSEITVTHLSDSEMNAYVNKQRLSDIYDQKWDDRYPTDVYSVEMQQRDNGSRLRLNLHLQSGKIVGWSRTKADAVTPAAAERSASPANPGDTPADPKQTAAALSWLKQQEGYAASDWEPTGKQSEDGAIVLQSRQTGLDEARLQMLVIPEEHLTYKYELPEDFTSYMSNQEKKASKLSMLAFMLPEIILFVLSVIYAAVYHSWSSFRRGIFLSCAFFLLYAGFTFNMKPGFRASAEEAGNAISDSGIQSLIVVNLVILLLQALLTYFAAVGGDGLWRFMGYKLWPRWRDSDYGHRVLRSMRQGYVLAVILLGAQTIVLIALQNSLGSFYGSDSSQSMYNMTYPWLLPLLGWCAGISEEIQTRLFGIGLFRRWLTGGARALLRREPSKRTAAILTAIATLPPTAIWAFGHVGYAVYPWQTRIIELMIMGSLFAWFMLRFGLMTVIFAHVVLDSTLMGVQMLTDGLSSDNLAGVASFIIPAAVGILIWWLHGRSSAARRTAAIS